MDRMRRRECLLVVLGVVIVLFWMVSSFTSWYHLQENHNQSPIDLSRTITSRKVAFNQYKRKNEITTWNRTDDGFATSVNLRGGQVLQMKGEWFTCTGQVIENPSVGQEVVHKNEMNDDYCDCVETGFDEQETAACAGSFLGSVFFCGEQDARHIPSSRVHDGVCDCCDGRDEGVGSSSCVNVCNQLVLERESALNAKLREWWQPPGSGY